MVKYHEPVLLNEVIEGLNIKKNGIYVDSTFGGGGHAKAILEKLDNGKVIAFDQDKDAMANIPDDERLLFFNHNFRFIKNFLMFHNLIPVDGLFADLGVSSYQFDHQERGFSTRFTGPLDMRMDKSAGKDAADIVNNYDEQKLVDVFRLYGELKNARNLAKTIIKERNNKSIESTDQLIEVLEQFAPRGKRNKFFAQVFQALRIEVNEELDALKEFLEQSPGVLKPGGRLVIISYHSLEDRLVKNFMKSGNFEGVIEKDFYGNKLVPFKSIKKLIIPSEIEIKRNNRARSAKLRIAEKT